MHENIFQNRQDHLWQVALGIVLFRYQLLHGNHFDLEQPAGSLFKHVPATQEAMNKSPCLPL
jgi:hypothetical protein